MKYAYHIQKRKNTYTFSENGSFRRISVGNTILKHCTGREYQTILNSFENISKNIDLFPEIKILLHFQIPSPFTLNYFEENLHVKIFVKINNVPLLVEPVTRRHLKIGINLIS